MEINLDGYVNALDDSDIARWRKIPGLPKVIRQPKAPHVHWGREARPRPNSTNGCPAHDGGSGGPNFEPTAGQGLGDWMPAVFLRIDGYPMPVEFGVYTYNGFIDFPPDSPAVKAKHAYLSTDRWGKRGQKFLFVRSLQHDFWGDWSMEGRPKAFADEDENHTMTGQYRSCVINFDTPKTQAKNSTVNKEIQK
jgi:hypothetical protein